MATIEQVVAKYRELRDAKAKIVEKHKLELVPYTATAEKLEAWLSGELLKQGVDSAKTKQGTAYVTTTTAVKVVDREATLAYLNESADNLQVLDIRVNVEAAADYINENEAPIPGTEVKRRRNIRVKK